MIFLQLLGPGLELFRQDRETRGGGVGLLVRSKFKAEIIELNITQARTWKIRWL